VIEIPSPSLLFLGDVSNPLDAKTAMGLRDWRPEGCVGQCRLPGCAVDLGLPDMSFSEAVAAGAHSVVIGVAPSGGALKAEWVSVLAEALRSGLSLVSGLHRKLSEESELVKAAAASGQQLIDIRVPPASISIATGRQRSGKRLLMVGTDCCVGKKYSALSLHKALQGRGIAATFRATGQTGILISGEGIPMDAVVSDFLSGAAEMLTPDAASDHWDVIEGQGSLFHPAYAAVTLGLLHGSQPDAMVLCHGSGRTVIDEYEDYPVPDLRECVAQYEQAARVTNRQSSIVGISLNTRGLNATQALSACRDASILTGLPCVDPMRHALDSIIDALP
jgi:uncharacterized NAD-dependent epimerase/dehydratase family protein